MNDRDMRRTLREEVFEHYVVPEIPVVARVALTLAPQPADAEDLVQDTLMRAYLGAERFDGRHPRAWLLTTLRNTWAKQNRRRRPELLQRQEVELGKAAPVVPQRENPEAVVLSEEFHAAAQAAFNMLPAKLRSALTLIIRGLSYAEAARALGIPPGTVMSRVHYARAHIRRRLAAEDASRGGEGDGPALQPLY